MEDRLVRFSDAPWIKEENPSVLIGGCGGIGSFLAFLLTRAGFNPSVYDFDTVEINNIGGQFFKETDITVPKVEAVADNIEEFTGTKINVFNERITKNSPSCKFTFSAFDNMKARRIMFDTWKNNIDKYENPLFMDGRLLMEQLQIFCVTPDNIEDYEKHLFKDSEVEDAACTLKQTTHGATMIASLMTGFFTNHMTNIYQGFKMREVPFFHEYFIPLNLTDGNN